MPRKVVDRAAGDIWRPHQPRRAGSRTALKRHRSRLEHHEPPRSPARLGRRHRPRVRRRRGGRSRAGRRDRRLPQRPVHGHHGAVRLGQVDADAHPRRPRPADLRFRPPRRGGDHEARRPQAHRAAPRAGGVRLPVVQPPARSRRPREHPPAAVDRGQAARRRVGRQAHRDRRARRPPRPPAVRALRRPAAARRGGPRAGLEARRRLRRRADRQPRLEVLGRAARPPAPLGRRVRPDGHHGHARPDRRLLRRPAARPRRRPHRPRRRGGDRRGRAGPHEGGWLVRKVALRGLFARKLRLILTALAVALGVTLIAGTYVFTDTINRSFDRIFTQSAKGTDASITPRKPIDTSNQGGTQPTVSRAILAQVRRQPGVQSADGSVFDVGTILGKNGKRIGKGGAPNFIASIADQPRFDGFTIKTGRKPQSADEVAMDASTVKKQGWKLGDKVAIVGNAPRKDFTLVGPTQIAGADSLGGAAIADMLLPEAQRMLGKRGFDQIQASAKKGVTPDKLRDQLKTALPNTVNVRTGQEEAPKQSDDIKSNLSFLTTLLLAFAGISLFVGAFIIFNTFSITVTQRMREFALLRTLGASRGQVMRSVITEGFTIGVLGSVIGLALGVLVAEGLRGLFRAIGVDLPSNGNVVATRTILVSLLVGTIVTVLSSLAPALRATRVPPVEALHEGAVPTLRGPSRKVTIAGAVLGLAGVGLMAAGLFGSFSSNASLSFVGGGALATFLGVALVSPYLIRPLASIVGRPFERTRGITGRLARENTTRQPGRTAVTAAALMVGVALVAFVSIFAAGVKTTIAKAVDDNLKAAFVVQNTDGFSPFSPAVLRRVERVPGVNRTSPVRFGLARVNGVKGNQAVSGIDPQTFNDLYGVSSGAAALDALGPGRIAISKKYGDDHKVKAGDTIRLTTSTGRKQALRVTGVVDDKGSLVAALIVTNGQMLTDFGEPKDAFGMVGIDPGADKKAVQDRITGVLDRQFPEAEVLTAKEFTDDVAGQVNQLLYLIYALLALAVIVSLFGIVNTLVLSISERTRELGLLRAVGTTQRQVRRIVRYEAVITSLIGGVLGIVLGAVLAVLFTQPLDNFTLSIPGGTLLLMLVVAGTAGVGAAVLPARRASRLDVLDALAYE